MNTQTVMMNAQTMSRASVGGETSDHQQRLNTYIYDYLLKSEKYDLARSFHTSMTILTKSPTKPSPSRQGVNGVDDAMDTDSKGDSKRPDDLPEPQIPPGTSDQSFLYDWWCQFWDVYNAQRKGASQTGAAYQYVGHNISATKMREAAQQRMLSRGGAGDMMNLQYQNMLRGVPNGMNMGREMQKQAMNNRITPQQIAQINMQKMSRDGSIDMTQGHQSPGAADNAPSPKRQRLEGNNFNGQPGGPAGRGQGAPGQQMGGGPNGQMMLQNGIGPNEMAQGQLGGFQGNTPNAQAAKSLEVYSQHLAAFHAKSDSNNNAKGMNSTGGPQGSPMPQQGTEMNVDYYAGQRMAAGPPGQSQGNHALQDYQMQLMLLEQQNKKRLLMARQEQDNLSHNPAGTQPGMVQPGFAPNMSPSGSRSGPSPNPNEQMKRGTPKMGPGGLPGSPMPDMSQNRGSPAPFDPSQGSIPPGMPQAYYQQQMQQNRMMQPPPSSHPPNFGTQQMNPQIMEQMRQQNGNRMPQNGQQMWQGGAPGQNMQPGQGGPQAGQMGNPQARQNNMPPPPAPPTEQNRTQPSSPAPSTNAPPTPSQTNKAAPKKPSKKEAAAKKAAANKKGAPNAGATPAADAEPPTPTPSTPITPMHTNSFNNQKNGTQPSAPAQAQAQPPTQGQPVAQQAMDTGAGNFAGLAADEPFNLDFANVQDTDNVLENFDFDSFLHNDGGDNFGINFDMTFEGVDPTEGALG
ncbi:hypothetical protein K402DRAFT_413217 [Aulographum hederae CBS 113979]|uniref:LisH domain-containing protein n=1 Tax=Aulographum hederae CBS 113979 TaxID=1176131 RepID=A0A6G1GY61_9PEZI|nr:hypothetical protein K402DRAFT_413217 [Aulographum hederae CBS 113979]